VFEKKNAISDTLFAALVWSAAAFIVACACWMAISVLTGASNHLSWAFVSTMPENAGRSGGIVSIIASTMIILVISLVAAVPLGLGTAIWLNEFALKRVRIASIMHLSLDILAGVPSIVFGLFGSALFCNFLGLGFSMLAGGLTLACMVLPIFTRAVEQGLSKVPHEWRVGAAALGLSKSAALRHILLPAITPAINAGMTLGIGRAMAETAALVFTSGYVDRMPGSIMDSGRSLSVHIYDLAMNVTGGDQAAYSTALVLMVLLVAIQGISSIIFDRFLKKRY
jgi:phosphate transport system permease protein